MKKLIALLMLVCATAVAQQYKEVVLIDGDQPLRGATGNVNRVYANIIPPLGDLNTIYTNAGFRYTNSAGKGVTNKYAVVGATTAIVRWRSTLNGEDGSPLTAVLDLQVSYDTINWSNMATLTAVTAATPVYYFTNLNVGTYGFLRVSSITNYSEIETLTNDVRVYFKVNN